MSDILTPLTVDFLAWLAPAPRPYAEVMEAWRTSCPRLTVWEDVLEAGFVARRRLGRRRRSRSPPGVSPFWRGTAPDGRASSVRDLPRPPFFHPMAVSSKICHAKRSFSVDALTPRPVEATVRSVNGERPTHERWRRNPGRRHLRMAPTPIRHGACPLFP
jgi:hypothetical protein